MAFYHRGQPHPDLPAIPEEGSGSPTPSSASTPNDENEDDDNNLEEVDINVVDDDDDDDNTSCSAAEHSLYSLNSYAFTLDNVGFDEENSLVGSVVGSVIGTSTNNTNGNTNGSSSVVHTPPSRYTPERISKHERNLHRETCRTLGLPYGVPGESSSSSGSSPSSSSSSSGGGVGSASKGSGSINSKESLPPGTLTAEQTHELELRRRKMDKMWPWPTTKGCKKKDSASLDTKMKNNVASTDDSKQKQQGSWSTYTDQMKEAMESFSVRIEDAYQKAKAKQNNATTTDTDYATTTSTTTGNIGGGEHQETLPSYRKKENPAVPKPALSQEKKVKINVHDLFKPSRVVDLYRQANPLARVTVGSTILLMLLCIVVISVSVGNNSGGSSDGSSTSTSVSDDSDPSSILGNSGSGLPNASTDPDRFADLLNTGDDDTTSSAGIVPTDALALTIWNTSMEATSTPTSYAPADVPTSSPVKLSPVSLVNDYSGARPNEAPSSCLDTTGKFQNTRGKYRECIWLTKTKNNNANNDDLSLKNELKSTRLDAECGELKQSSELGLNCRYTCRAYNGCLLVPGGEGEAIKEEKEEYAKLEAGGVELGLEVEKVEKVQHVPDTEFPTGSAVLTGASTTEPTTKITTWSTAMQTSKPTSPSPISSDGIVVDEPAGHTIDAVETADLPAFIDIRGQGRQCWWLDIRNLNRQQVRRDANCVKGGVQAACPSSCADYVATVMTAMNMYSGQIMAQAGTLGGEGAGGDSSDDDDSGDDDSKGEDNDAAFVVLAASSSPQQSLRTNEDANIPPPNEIEPQSSASQLHEITKFQYHHDPLPQDMCYDGRGYYLNDRGQPKQCSWLIGSDSDEEEYDPTDETRRIKNCGYSGSQYPEGSDLGRMCKDTCGTCGL